MGRLPPVAPRRQRRRGGRFVFALALVIGLVHFAGYGPESKEMEPQMGQAADTILLDDHGLRRLEESAEQKMVDHESSWIYVGELLTVIILSICFERGQDRLIDRFREMGKLGESLEQMMKVLSTEIMILGFIGLMVYVLTKTRAALDLARYVYPSNVHLSEEENPLSETFECVHMIIFCVMICFICQCGIFMWKALRTSKKWRRWEDMRVHSGNKNEPSIGLLLQKCGYLPENWSGHKSQDLADDWAKVIVPTNPILRILGELLHSNEALDVLQWRSIRHNFMFPSHDGHEEMFKPSEPQFFQFSEYLSVKLAEEFMEIIEIDTVTWIVAMVLALFIPSFKQLDPFWHTTAIAILSWTIVGTVFCFYIHISSCYHQITPQLPEHPQICLELFRGTSKAALQRDHRNRMKQLHSGVPPGADFDRSMSPSLCSDGRQSPEPPILPPIVDHRHVALSPLITHHGGG